VRLQDSKKRGGGKGREGKNSISSGRILKVQRATAGSNINALNVIFSEISAELLIRLTQTQTSIAIYSTIL
jgi:hypothetical protein